MRKTSPIAIAALAPMLAACTASPEKKVQNPDIDFEPLKADTTSMPDYSNADTLVRGSHTLVYEISRTATDSLPMVKDDMNHYYLDNTVRITVARDGNTYFDRRFTKQNFTSLLPAADRDQSTLTGISFQSYQDGKMVFQLLISSLLSDIYLPFNITIGPDGSHSVERVEEEDLRPTEEE